jgi:hypothetical protein
MCKLIFFVLIFFASAPAGVSQVLYVDATRGTKEGNGTVTDPLSTIEAAVALASTFAGKEPVAIKIYPGLYDLHYAAIIKTAATYDTISYTVEAVMMPGNPDWQPSQVPVIRSVSPDNSTTQFAHSAGFIVAKNNVHFKGLKFLGNSNPQVAYYYPITRENPAYSNLQVSQCYFIGDKNSAPIQGAIWAHGKNTTVDHCIFYGCKNALLLFQNINNFSLTHSIIYGSYEAAAWYAGTGNDLLFSNNVIANNNCFWARPPGTSPAYTFSNSVITGNKIDYGFSGETITATTSNAHTEKNIRKTGKVELVEAGLGPLPKDHLHLTASSAGSDLDAGVLTR